MKDLCQVVQSVMIHIGNKSLHGVELSKDRKEEQNIRTVEEMLTRIQELDNQPLTEIRPLEKRLVTMCRGLSTMLCSMLRHQGVPARVRCGFAAYFSPGEYLEHWICEYWHKEQGFWVMVDPQLHDVDSKASSRHDIHAWFLPSWNLARVIFHKSQTNGSTEHVTFLGDKTTDILGRDGRR